MRNITCPVCSETQYVTRYPARFPAEFNEETPPPPYLGHYQIVECSQCNTVRSCPIMDEAGVKALYEKSSETNVTPGEEGNVQRTMDGYYKIAQPYLGGRRRFLDVGCDMGFLLQSAKNDGFRELYGLEPVPKAKEIAEKIPGAIISSEFFEFTDYPDNFFDLITLIHVVDHLVDPQNILDRVYNNLAPGGVVLAVVHNVDCTLGKLLGERFPIFNFYHHYFFNKTTLAKLFAKCGFEVIAVTNTKNCYSLGFFISRVPKIPEFLRSILLHVSRLVGVADIPINLSIGNIAIAARKPNVPK